MQNNDIIINVENLTKKYGDLIAVNNISFNVRRGQFFAFLGPNGAGKSTTIKILTTLLQQDDGKFFLNNKEDNIYIRKKIGVVFQENMLDGFLTVKENLILHGSLFLKTKQEVVDRYNQLKSQFSFEGFENKQCRFLSGGQARRIEIAKALFGNPEILFLDEPTTGLDPESRKVVWKILDDLRNQKNITIFLTTHYMEETNNADYIVIINKGEIVANGTPNQLKQRHAKDVFKVIPKNKSNFANFLKSNGVLYKKNADSYVLYGKSSDECLDILLNNKNNINQFELIKGTMDDVFINVIEGGK